MGYNILIVDDSSIARSVIGKTLRLTNIPVNDIYFGVNGKEGLKLLDEHWIDIVFADINMPVMNGLEMIDEMSANGLLQDIPVIIISTEGSKSRIEELTRKGIKGYIRKPFTPEKLRDTINEMLGT